MIHIIYFKFPGVSTVKCAFTTRVGGHSLGNFSANLSYEVGDQIEHVKKNRQHILNQLNIKEVIEVKQIHGDKLICVDNTNFKEQPILKGDAIISSKKKCGTYGENRRLSACFSM